MSTRPASIRSVLCAMLIGLAAGCQSDNNPLVPPPPSSGQSIILVTLLITGTAPDSNGYRVVVDQD